VRRLRVVTALAVAGVLAACNISWTELAPPDPVVTVLAYNIHHGEGTGGVLDLERIAALIREHDPDVVTLQEVDRGTERTGRVDQARRLADLTGMEAVFGPFMPYQGGEYGMAILTRLEILESHNHRLPPGAEPRTALTVRVRTPGGSPLWVSGVHFYRTERERLAQANRLLRTLSNQTDPVILAGDFNSLRGDRVMDAIGEEFGLPVKQGPPNTFPSNVPEREIDFFALRPASHFTILEHRVVDERVASDHGPILLRVRMGS